MTMFACTTKKLEERDPSMDTESRDMFQKLYRYIQGVNMEGTVMKMTLPVFTFRHENNDGMVDKISMCFWMNQSNEVFMSQNKKLSLKLIILRLLQSQNQTAVLLFGK